MKIVDKTLKNIDIDEIKESEEYKKKQKNNKKVRFETWNKYVKQGSFYI